VLLHNFISTLTAYHTNVSYAVTKQKKYGMLAKVLLHSGMRLQAVTQRNNWPAHRHKTNILLHMVHQFLLWNVRALSKQGQRSFSSLCKKVDADHSGLLRYVVVKCYGFHAVEFWNPSSEKNLLSSWINRNMRSKLKR